MGLAAQGAVDQADPKEALQPMAWKPASAILSAGPVTGRPLAEPCARPWAGFVLGSPQVIVRSSGFGPRRGATKGLRSLQTCYALSMIRQASRCVSESLIMRAAAAAAS